VLFIICLISLDHILNLILVICIFGHLWVEDCLDFFFWLFDLRVIFKLFLLFYKLLITKKFGSINIKQPFRRLLKVENIPIW